MTFEWAIRIQKDHMFRVGRIRSEPRIEAAIQGDYVWIRGAELSDSLGQELVTIADGQVYRIDENVRLVPVGDSVPVCKLPELPWQPLHQLCRTTLPVAAMPVAEFETSQMKLVRSDIKRTPALLIANSQDFLLWADSAPDARLAVLKFARRQPVNSEADTVLVQGRPLPPIPGTMFWAENQIAVPLGMHWSPAVDSATLSVVLSSKAKRDGRDVSDTTWLVWTAGDKGDNADVVHVIDGSAFVPSARANVRLLRAPS